MDSEQHLQHLRRELDEYAAALSRAADRLDAPVVHCGDWSVRDLTHHLGGVHRWVLGAVREGRRDRQGAPGPDGFEELCGWFSAGADELLVALDADPSAPAWTFTRARTVGFWQRRQCHENAIHRWDLETALGGSPVLDRTLSADGVAEVVDVFVHRQIERGRATAPKQAVRLVATDAGGAWVIGSGEPVASLSGSSEALLLALWQRRSVAGAGAAGTLTWDGDVAAGHAVLARRLTP